MGAMLIQMLFSSDACIVRTYNILKFAPTCFDASNVYRLSLVSYYSSIFTNYVSFGVYFSGICVSLQTCNVSIFLGRKSNCCKKSKRFYFIWFDLKNLESRTNPIRAIFYKTCRKLGPTAPGSTKLVHGRLTVSSSWLILLRNFIVSDIQQ